MSPTPPFAQRSATRSSAACWRGWPSPRPATGCTTSPCWRSCTSGRAPPPGPASDRGPDRALRRARAARRRRRRPLGPPPDDDRLRPRACGLHGRAGGGRGGRAADRARPVLAALATAAGCPYITCVAAVTPRLVADADLGARERGARGDRPGEHRGRPGVRRAPAAARLSRDGVPRQRGELRPGRGRRVPARGPAVRAGCAGGGDPGLLADLRPAPPRCATRRRHGGWSGPTRWAASSTAR